MGHAAGSPASDPASSTASRPEAGASGPRAIFVRPGLALETGGLTKAVLGRIRLYDSAGWAVHLSLVRDDPDIDRTLDALRADGLLPSSVAVHHFARDRAPRRRVVMPWSRSLPALTTEAWLDGIAAREGAVVFADSPVTYSMVSRMSNPRVARVFAVHLCHLSAAATRLGSPEAVANGPLTPRWSAVSVATLRSADRIVVLTEAQGRDFSLRWGSDLPVSVIPHCAHAVEPDPSATFDPGLVVGLGQLRRMKRWDDAIRVMARVVTDVPTARLVVHGSGLERDRLLAVTQELGMPGSVSFPGYTNTPLADMAHAACTLSMTRREAMPLTLLESLSVGTPVVVTDVRYGPREIVRDRVDGFVVPAHDISAAAAAVVRLLTEPDLREGMSQAAREVVRRSSCEAHDSAWLSLGREVYEHRGRTASLH